MNRRFLSVLFAIMLIPLFPHPGRSMTDTTISGLTGTFLVPGLDVLPPGGARGGLHVTGSGDANVTALKGAFSFSDDCEIAVAKRFARGKRSEDLEPVLSAKYKLRPNLALAAVIDPTPGYRDSLILVSGVPGNRIVLGMGANVASDPTEKYAHFGRYSGKVAMVDSVFFLMGATMKIDPDTDFTMDYAGNDFILGVRHHFDERVGLDLGYFSPDKLTREARYCLGLSFGF